MLTVGTITIGWDIKNVILFSKNIKKIVVFFGVGWADGGGRRVSMKSATDLMTMCFLNKLGFLSRWSSSPEPNVSCSLVREPRQWASHPNGTRLSLFQVNEERFHWLLSPHITSPGQMIPHHRLKIWFLLGWRYE